MNNTTPEQPPPQPVSLPNLIVSLEQATLMAKQIPATTDPNLLLQIYSSLHQAHHHLSSFIAHAQISLFSLPPPQPLPLPSHAVAAENSVSSATGAATVDENGNEPMQVGDDNDDYEAGVEENSKSAIYKVEERMRDCFIKNKRPKRPLSPSSAAVGVQGRLGNDGYAGGVKGFDPHGTKLRALDLIYQFHS